MLLGVWALILDFGSFAFEKLHTILFFCIIHQSWLSNSTVSCEVPLHLICSYLIGIAQASRATSEESQITARAQSTLKHFQSSQCDCFVLYIFGRQGIQPKRWLDRRYVTAVERVFWFVWFVVSSSLFQTSGPPSNTLSLQRVNYHTFTREVLTLPVL